MEIPNSSIYEDISEEELSSKKERLPNIDFFNENLNLTFSFEDDVMKNLPEITDVALETGKEQYRIFLGRINQSDINDVNVEIVKVDEIPAGPDEGFYEEKTDEVTVNLRNVKNHANYLCQVMPKLKNCFFVGDIHTHPKKQSDLDDWQHPCNYSEEDLKSICDNYEEGTLSSNEPFIFAIAGREGKETNYVFYHIIKKGDKYEAKVISMK